jgi:SAM-dependent methyltransferase
MSAVASGPDLLVGMGETKVSKTQPLSALGLGSCIGLLAYCPLSGVAGMAHIMLPEAFPNQPIPLPGKFADTALPHLLADRFDQGFDLIMCRNVVIYFNDDAKDLLYERFVQSLKPGGVLFVGSTERIYKAKEIGLETPWPFFYRKPIIEREQRWRRAS